jgi:methyl-accepting chemotaxis protein
MTALANLSIAKKLVAAFTTFITVAILVSFINYSKLSFIETSNGWTSHTQEVLEETSRMLVSMVNQETGVRGYLLAGDDKFLEPYRAGQRVYAEAFAKAKQLTADNPVQQARLAEVERFAQMWRTTVAEQEIALMAKPETHEQARAMEASGVGKTSMDGLRATIAEIDKMERDLFAKRAADQAQAFSTSYIVNIVGGAALILIAVSAGFLLSRGIAVPIRGMTAVMGRLAAGDNTVLIEGLDRRDEIGAMAKAVEVFKLNAIENSRLAAQQDELKAQAEAERKRMMHELANQFEATVKTVVSQVSSAATQMQGSSQALSSMAEESRAQATAVAASTEQTSANVQTVAASSEEMANSIGEITRQVGQSADIARRAADHAQTTNTTIQTLAEQAKGIGDVVQLINSIAAQTNLLALNATIEAARAGEAGKGFAVVASEVKNLATQTAKATEEISAQITAMQQATSGAVGAITEITHTIGEINQIATTIAAAIEEQDAATREIARNVQQAAQGTQEISTNIVGVQHAAEGTGKAASEVLEAARELFRDSEKLSSEVESFIQQVRTA